MRGHAVRHRHTWRVLSTPELTFYVRPTLEGCACGNVRVAPADAVHDGVTTRVIWRHHPEWGRTFELLSEPTR